ncbi:hypothetical protein BKA93DRAFT_814527 [Sparassis latifolia]
MLRLLSSHRYASLAAALIGTLCNFVVAVRLLALWRSLGWESESEWEAKADVWRVDSVKIIWALLSAYFAAAAAACCAGLIGLAKNSPSFVRFYRDYSIGDFVFTTAGTLFLSYASFSRPYVRTSVCEEISRHPELIRDLSEMGLTLENCELWFERAVLAVMGMMFILIVIRLHMVIAISKLYHHLVRDIFTSAKSHTSLRPISTDSLHRIYLLPTPTSPSSGSFNFNNNVPSGTSPSEDIVVYAPVPVGGMSEADARKMNATEAWISSPTSPRSHRHSRSYSYSHSHPHSHSHRHSRSTASVLRQDSGTASTDEKTELESLA